MSARCIPAPLVWTWAEDAPIFVIYVVEGLLITALFWTYAVLVRSLWIKWSRRHHHHLLQEARKAADKGGAAEGPRVEPG